MEFKPFPVHVGYYSKVTEYEMGKRGKSPSADVMNWFAEIGINWQFEWQYPEATDPSGVFEMVEYVDIVTKLEAKAGGTFYFETEEDRLLFCLTWMCDDTLYL